MVSNLFTLVDWFTLILYLLFTTLIGHLLKGKQATIKDFFLGGNKLPWYAVSGSIIATEISGVTLIGLPALVYSEKGNLTFFQWLLFMVILSRIFVAIFFTKYYYKNNIYSPYDLMEIKLGKKIKTLATIVFSIGTVFGQTVRVLVAGLTLVIITGLDIKSCIIFIGIFAIIWTLMGGITTVIWTDFIQFLLFSFVGIISIFLVFYSSGVDFNETIDILKGNNIHGVNKLKFFDFNFSWKNDMNFWTALICTPFLGLNAYGVDQLMTQRMFCCKNEKEAKKAIIFSSVSVIVYLSMMIVGLGLYVFYYKENVIGNAPELFKINGNYVFPYWIISNLPIVIKGLFIGGIFAAVISSLDSTLAALSQTSISLFKNLNNVSLEADKKNLKISKILIIFWGISLTFFTIILNNINNNNSLIELAFGMVSYTTGILLALFIASVLSNYIKISVKGLIIGSIISFLIVLLFIRTDLYTMMLNNNILDGNMVEKLTFNLLKYDEIKNNLAPKISHTWMYPFNFIITLFFGIVNKSNFDYFKK